MKTSAAERAIASDLKIKKCEIELHLHRSPVRALCVGLEVIIEVLPILAFAETECKVKIIFPLSREKRGGSLSVTTSPPSSGFHPPNSNTISSSKLGATRKKKSYSPSPPPYPSPFKKTAPSKRSTSGTAGQKSEKRSKSVLLPWVYTLSN